jgi:hypothetical protein
MTLPLLPEQAAIEQEFVAQFAEEMGAIDFAESLPESATPEQMNRIAPALIRFLLQSGDKGYKDSISHFEPQPSQKNNWLYDIETNAFEGKFVDVRPGTDRVFAFEIRKEGDEWIRSFQPISGVDD